MQVAVITITFNDDYKFNEWCAHYEQYKQDVALHIIVDNGSSPQYLQKVRQYFTNSVIIERTTNGGCTGAYNDGIKKALSDPKIDAIVLLGNDIKLSKNAIPALYELLYSDSRIEMVAPVEMKIGADTIVDRGCKISLGLSMKSIHQGEKIQELNSTIQYAEAVSGGYNMASRKFYETVGLQDENLFMYGDEVDMGIRAKQCGFRMATTTKAQCWHCHINPPGNMARKPYAAYLMGRNKVYIARKISFSRTVYVFAYKTGTAFLNYMTHIQSKEYRKYYACQFRGIWDGLTKNMNSKLFHELIEK